MKIFIDEINDLKYQLYLWQFMDNYKLNDKILVFCISILKIKIVQIL